MFSKKVILIGTTAITRSVLHSDNMPAWVQFIKNLDPSKYEVRWFINVDYIAQLGESAEDTQQNFRELLDGIPVTFIEKPVEDICSGNFLNACKNIATCIEEYVLYNKLKPEDTLVLWLEDDWKLNPNNIPLQRIIEQYVAGNTYVNFTFIRNNYVHALAPCIMNYVVFEDIHMSAWKAQTEHIDPEHCVGKWLLGKVGKYENIQNMTVISQFKKVDADFFKHQMLNDTNSYYTFDMVNDNCMTDSPKYVEGDKVVSHIGKDTLTFVRLTCSLCIDGGKYGRDFMKTYDLHKTGKQNKASVEFYA